MSTPVSRQAAQLGTNLGGQRNHLSGLAQLARDAYRPQYSLPLALRVAVDALVLEPGLVLIATPDLVFLPLSPIAWRTRFRRAAHVEAAVWRGSRHLRPTADDDFGRRRELDRGCEWEIAGFDRSPPKFPAPPRQARFSMLLAAPELFAHGGAKSSWTWAPGSIVSKPSNAHQWPPMTTHMAGSDCRRGRYSIPPPRVLSLFLTSVYLSSFSTRPNKGYHSYYSSGRRVGAANGTLQSGHRSNKLTEPPTCRPPATALSPSQGSKKSRPSWSMAWALAATTTMSRVDTGLSTPRSQRPCLTIRSTRNREQTLVSTCLALSA